MLVHVHEYEKGGYTPGGGRPWGSLPASPPLPPPGTLSNMNEDSFKYDVNVAFGYGPSGIRKGRVLVPEGTVHPCTCRGGAALMGAGTPSLHPCPDTLAYTGAVRKTVPRSADGYFHVPSRKD